MLCCVFCSSRWNVSAANVSAASSCIVWMPALQHPRGWLDMQYLAHLIHDEWNSNVICFSKKVRFCMVLCVLICVDTVKLWRCCYRWLGIWPLRQRHDLLCVFSLILNTRKNVSYIEIFIQWQADRGFAAVAFLGGAEGFFLKKRVSSSAGYGFPRRKKSSASLQYCKY